MAKQFLPTAFSICHAGTVRKAARRLSNLYDTALSDSGLKLSQYTILAEIARHTANPLTMQELADILVMDRSTLGHNLRPLEREGLTALKADVKDRRRRYVLLTPAGRRQFRRAELGWAKAQAYFEEVFGTNRAHELRKVLLGIADNKLLSPKQSASLR
jgi:DNA-binding MarR family transcriptional regulator